MTDQSTGQEGVMTVSRSAVWGHGSWLDRGLWSSGHRGCEALTLGRHPTQCWCPAPVGDMGQGALVYLSSLFAPRSQSAVHLSHKFQYFII